MRKVVSEEASERLHTRPLKPDVGCLRTSCFNTQRHRESTDRQSTDRACEKFVVKTHLSSTNKVNNIFFLKLRKKITVEF